MKKTVVVVTLMFAILLNACSQIPGFGPTPAAGAQGDTAGTATAQFNIAVMESLTAQAQPTLTATSVTDTATLPVLVELPTLPPPTDTPVSLPTFSPVPNLTTTPATATSGPTGTLPAGVTATATLAAGQPTASATLGIRKFGTQPPQVPFNRITLTNKSKAEAYISLQVTMNDGKLSILEYPVQGTIKIEAPVGSYLYVAWVGGRKMVGSFRLTPSDEISITLYKDRVVLK